MNRIIALGLAAACTVGLLAGQVPAQEPRPVGNIDFEAVINSARQGGIHRPGMGNFRDFNEVTKDATKVEGLFTLYRTGDHLYGEIRLDQFNQPFLVPVTIARGLAQAGVPVGDDELVLMFRKVGERIQLVRRNIHYKASPGSSLDKSVQQNYTDSVLMALPIVTINMMRGGAR